MLNGRGFETHHLHKESSLI